MINGRKFAALFSVSALALAVGISGCSLKEPVQPASAPVGAVAGAASEVELAEVPSLEGKTIGIAAKDILHDYSRGVYQELEARIKELGGKVIATQAEAKDDKHVANVENLITQKPDAIVVILGDAQTLTPALAKVDAAGIPLFTIDFQTPYSKNNVTSDNWNIGTHLARTLAEDIGGNGEILAFNGFPGVTPCRIRYESLLLVLKDYPEIKIIEPELQDKYEDTIEDAKNQISDQLRRLPEGSVDAIWSCWDMPLIGAAQALDTANREEIGLYGVDAEPGALDLIADPNSAYQFTVGQPTDAIAVRSAENIARFLGGEEDKVRKTTYVDPIFIDKENVAKVRADLGI
ncbi:ribose transport system substrate-binding protein [Neomicrococcus aestuarii]|uniref:Ribose transport system substrate-binding protein n=1 Tax=Neomicrococcus aestuarii TaxID=556325 RepID=A0A7W8WZW7_9MICC|nr:substrate-binding domain-containing protein [Neomicrococcus aestuarii]MBB5512238.1 ribose transport system substrate-binding protein [Neomicrococcus aestuarii]